MKKIKKIHTTENTHKLIEAIAEQWVNLIFAQLWYRAQKKEKKTYGRAT